MRPFRPESIAMYILILAASLGEIPILLAALLALILIAIWSADADKTTQQTESSDY